MRFDCAQSRFDGEFKLKFDSAHLLSDGAHLLLDGEFELKFDCALAVRFDGAVAVRFDGSLLVGVGDALAVRFDGSLLVGVGDSLSVGFGRAVEIGVSNVVDGSLVAAGALPFMIGVALCEPLEHPERTSRDPTKKNRPAKPPTNRRLFNL